MLNPIKIGLFQIGTVLRTDNPRYGLQKGFIDYSFRNDLNNGGYSQTQRNVASIYSGNILVTRSQAESFIEHFRGYRSKPFPVLILNDMPSGHSEGKTYSGLYYFQEAPTISYNYKQAEMQQINFRFREVL